MTLNREIPPLTGDFQKVLLQEPKKIQFENGLNLFALSSGTQDVIRLEFVFNAGTKYQKKKLVASATNKLLVEGANGKSAHLIAEEFDYYGAFLQTEVSHDKASVVLYCLEKQLDKLLPVLKEVLTAPDFNQKEINTYLTNARQGFIVDREKVANLARRKINEVLFANHPYGQVALLEDFENVTREDLLSFYESHYDFSNCEIFLSGKFMDKVTSKIKSHFGSLGMSNKMIQNISDVIPSDKQITEYVEKEDAIQSGIRYGKVLFNRTHDDYPGMQVVNTILGGYFGSRLMSNIREDKGYTYGIGSAIVSFKNGGYLTIATEVGSEVTKATLKEIDFEIDRLKNEPVGDQELDLVQNYMLGSFLKSIDGVFNVMDRFKIVHDYSLNYDYYDHYVDVIQKITAQDIQQLAKKHLHSNGFVRVISGQTMVLEE